MKYKKIQGNANIHLQLQNNKKVQKLKEKGITLIALVVTIIILLILVGVTISQITGENGLIKRAREAVEKYKNASEEEQIQLGELEQYVSDFEIIGENEGFDIDLSKIHYIGSGHTGTFNNVLRGNNFKFLMFCVSGGEITKCVGHGSNVVSKSLNSNKTWVIYGDNITLVDWACTGDSECIVGY